jgi:hypothetical protein
MPLELLKLPVSFVMRAKFSGEPYSSLVDSVDFIQARTRALEICVEEDKYFVSERKHRDVGVGFAEEHFMDNYFPGFDDGFAAAYQYRKPLNHTEPNPRCFGDPFIILQRHEMWDFVRRFREYEEFRYKKEFTFEQAFEDFITTYFSGWRIGFRAGYCGLSCGSRENCEVGGKYFVLNLNFNNISEWEEQWMESVHGHHTGLSD